MACDLKRILSLRLFLLLIASKAVDLREITVSGLLTTQKGIRTTFQTSDKVSNMREIKSLAL